jgi:hypothetical protein
MVASNARTTEAKPEVQGLIGAGLERVPAEADIEIDDRDFLAAARKASGDAGAGRGFAHAALA